MGPEVSDRDRVAELEAAMNEIWEMAQHAPVASRAEKTICAIQAKVRQHVNGRTA